MLKGWSQYIYTEEEKLSPANPFWKLLPESKKKFLNN